MILLGTPTGIVTISEPVYPDISHIIPLDENEILDAKEFLVQVDQRNLTACKKNIYFEAGNQSLSGKEAVALVTLNRMRASNYPDTVCGVVYQRKQFSWTFLKKNHNPPLDNILERRQWGSVW